MATALLARLPIQRVHRIAVSSFFFLFGLCFATWASRIPDIKLELQLSDGELGGVLFALPVGLMTSLPISGWIVGKYGSRIALTVGAVLYPITLIFLGLAATRWQLAAALFVFGLWGNMCNIAANTQAVGVEGMYGRSIMASFHGVWSLAGFSGALIGSVIIAAHIIPPVHFAIITAVALSLNLLFFKQLLPADNRAASQPIFAKPDATLLKLGLIAFCSMVAEGTMFDWSGVYFQKVVAAPKELETLGYVAFMSTMATGRFVADWLTNKIGKKTTLQISGLLITTGLTIAIIFPFLIPATIGFLLVGFGVSSIVPLIYGVAGKSKTMSAGVAIAAVSTIGFLGFLLGPPTIGFIAQVSSLKWSFTLIAALAFCNIILAAKVEFE
ncbi:MFS transporter [Ilyomonas limi]|uniref:MFS transporter n=1 Tax=Ilyomonas limi TaxID=2575867 RepID=A0A4V5UU31_9BACT|nr:MFS transporter [Ilyomonas limi]TKK67443.1 MFS transporter [Ilyomonas limi]